MMTKMAAIFNIPKKLETNDDPLEKSMGSIGKKGQIKRNSSILDI